MEFSRIGTHTIRCVITEAEISNLGYSVEDILSNAESTQEFMNEIFDLAEEKLGVKFNMGIKTVRADFLSNHTISLTFSEEPANQKMSGFMEHLLDYFNGMLEGLKEEKDQKLHQSNKSDDDSERIHATIMLEFHDMNTLCKYAANVNMGRIPQTSLYKLKNAYYLMLNLTSFEKKEIERLSALTDEYVDDLLAGEEFFAYVKEHGTVLISDEAIQKLAQI